LSVVHQVKADGKEREPTDGGFKRKYGKESDGEDRGTGSLPSRLIEPVG